MPFGNPTALGPGNAMAPPNVVTGPSPPFRRGLPVRTPMAGLRGVPRALRIPLHRGHGRGQARIQGATTGLPPIVTATTLQDGGGQALAQGATAGQPPAVTVSTPPTGRDQTRPRFHDRPN